MLEENIFSDQNYSRVISNLAAVCKEIRIGCVTPKQFVRIFRLTSIAIQKAPKRGGMQLFFASRSNFLQMQFSL